MAGTRSTPYKVSTITAVATISTCIDLDLFFDNIEIETAMGAGDTSGTFLFVGKGAHGAVRTRGTRPTKAKKSRVSETRFFDHQVTVVYSTCMVNADAATTHRECHNIKVFHNGNLQLTGVKSLEGGERAVRHVAEAVTRIARLCPGVLPLGLEAAPPVAANFRACLINSDFNAGYVLRRDRLYSLVSGPLYGVRCVFETYYPGVKVQFMWNSVRGAEQDGVCRCPLPCPGTGDGTSAGNCRKITMSVFQSGCCIITGAHTYAQLDHAHSFLTRVFMVHESELSRPTVTLPHRAARPILKDPPGTQAHLESHAAAAGSPPVLGLLGGSVPHLAPAGHPEAHLSSASSGAQAATCAGA